MAEESSQLEDLLGDFPAPAPLFGKIQELLILSILVLRVITNTVIIVAGDASARTGEPS